MQFPAFLLEFVQVARLADASCGGTLCAPRVEQLQPLFGVDKKPLVPEPTRVWPPIHARVA